MELKFKYRFEAAHRFTNSTSPACMTPHGHTWHAVLHLQSLRPLNEEGMVVEFSQAKSFWKTFVTETLDHSYLCHHKDALLPALMQIHEKARVLQFPLDPTTEMISLLLFHKAETMLTSGKLAAHLRVAAMTIEETPTNSLTCTREYYLENIPTYQEYRGWWTSLDPQDRSFTNPQDRSFAHGNTRN